MTEIETNSKCNSHEDTYLNEEGLLMCRRCHSLRQRKLPIMGKTRTVHCMCNCELQQIKAEKHRSRVQSLRIEGIREPLFLDWTFEKDDNTNEEASRAAKRYVDDFGTMLKNGTGLILYGEVGVGKTFLAACIANALIDREYECMMTDFFNVRQTIESKLDNTNDYFRKLNSFDLLVIDDLGTERNTKYMDEMVYNIVNNRYKIRKPLIITTNLKESEMRLTKDTQKLRIYTRLLEMCIPIGITGANRRIAKMGDNYMKYQQLLGFK